MSRKVLVVDDSPNIQKLITKILSVNNYQVETADNGAQALDKYAKFKPDIVTLDITMPVMDGYETLSRILQLDRDALIIMLSAVENEESVLRCLQKGAAGYLMKPFKEEELLGIINKVSSLDYDKHIDTFFLQVGDKLDSSIKKLFHPFSSVILKDVRVIRQERSPQELSQTLDASKIKSVPKTMEPLKIEKPEGTIGYVSEFNGGQQGMIVSFIKEEDLHMLINCQNTHSKAGIEDYNGELFNIINMKILSELSDCINLRLNSAQTRPYDETKDKNATVNELAKARFEIILDEKSIPLDVYLCFSVAHVFDSRINALTLR